MLPEPRVECKCSGNGAPCTTLKNVIIMNNLPVWYKFGLDQKVQDHGMLSKLIKHVNFLIIKSVKMQHN